MNNSNGTPWSLLFALGFGISAIASLTLIEHKEWFGTRPVSGTAVIMPEASIPSTN